MKAAGVPTIPGSEGILADFEEAKACAHDIGYPIMLKATAGGGQDDARHVEGDADHQARDAQRPDVAGDDPERAGALQLHLAPESQPPRANRPSVIELHDGVTVGRVVELERPRQLVPPRRERDVVASRGALDVQPAPQDVVVIDAPAALVGDGDALDALLADELRLIRDPQRKRAAAHLGVLATRVVGADLNVD
mgnify:CR=1 FL=1